MGEISFQDIIKKSNIDFKFISALEGECIENAYVPSMHDGKPDASKGVIVGSGFDLGRHNYEYLRKIGLNPTLRGKLYPYLGRKGKDAIGYLKNNTLHISKHEAQAINLGHKALALGKLIKRYDEDSQLVFCDLPSCWQTVIASVEFQHGNLKKAYPQFWLSIVRQHWKIGLDELRDFGDNDPVRRAQEAKYILDDGVPK